MRKKLLFCFLSIYFLFQPHTIFAESNYVLPYPSVMPGTVWYKVHNVLERVEYYWYFGSFGQYVYNLKFADKYLVESKVLFEYKQYLLADEALRRSTRYFQKVLPALQTAKKEGKYITEKEMIFETAAEKHREILYGLLPTVPESFIWSPEKQAPTLLPLHEHIKEAIAARESTL